MKAICKFKCFFRGRSVPVGEAIDITVAEQKTDIVKSSFSVLVDPSAGNAGKAAPKDLDLDIEEYRRRLTELNIVFKPKDDKATLKALYTDALASNTTAK